MIVVNRDWVIKKTALDRKYVANEITGDFLDVNDTTYNILCLVKCEQCSVDELIHKLCKMYNIEPEYIIDDVNELLCKLKSFGVVGYE